MLFAFYDLCFCETHDIVMLRLKVRISSGRDKSLFDCSASQNLTAANFENIVQSEEVQPLENWVRIPLPVV